MRETAFVSGTRKDRKALTLDDRIKQLLKELGDAINESISGSEDVNDRIQRIREEGYNLYVVLDATIGLNKEDEAQDVTAEGDPEGGQQRKNQRLLSGRREDVQFRIDITDLGFLRSIGIDPTRKVRAPKRIEGRTGTDQSS